MAKCKASYLAEDGSDFRDNFVDGDGGEASFAFDDAGFEGAAPALDLVVEDAVLLSVRKPDAGFVAGGEYRDAGGLDGGGEVHGAAVVSDEDAGL